MTFHDYSIKIDIFASTTATQSCHVCFKSESLIIIIIIFEASTNCN